MATIRRAQRNTPFVQIDKTALQDKTLSWKAKGILSYLLSLPDDWQIYLSEIKNHATDGRDSTQTGIDELIKAGYITRQKSIGEKGRFAGYDYTVSDFPQRLNRNGKPEYGKSTTTNNNSTNNIKNNIEVAFSNSTPPAITEDEVKEFDEQSKPKPKRNRFVKPTLSELEDCFQKKLREKKVLGAERTAKVEAEGFYNYYEANGWKVGRNKMSSWPHAVGGWISRMKNYKTHVSNEKDSIRKLRENGAYDGPIISYQ